jgi:hypothetical protein
MTQIPEPLLKDWLQPAVHGGFCADLAVFHLPDLAAAAVLGTVGERSGHYPKER